MKAALGNEMKILFLTVGIVNYDCDINFFDPLKFHFPETAYFNYIEEMETHGQRAMNKNLLTRVIQEKPDYIFWHTYRHEIFLRTLRLIRETGTKVIAWFSDDQWRFDSYSKRFLHHIDYAVTTYEPALDRYRNLNMKAIHCQWAANQRFYKKKSVSGQFEATFLGQLYGERVNYLDKIRNAGIGLELFGRTVNRYLSFDDIVDLFNQSRINLNFSASSKDSSIKQIKARLFEVTMCGGFLLTEYAPFLENYFKIGEEIVCFENIEEAIVKLKYYLEHENERKAIAEAGYKVAQESHTWDKRIQMIFMEINRYEANDALKSMQSDMVRTYFAESKEQLGHIFISAKNSIKSFIKKYIIKRNRDGAV